MHMYRGSFRFYLFHNVYINIMGALRMNIIGHITTDFPTKFGIPRQSGLREELKGVITFEPEYRHSEAFRGLEEFSHIWILWEFSKNNTKNWSATVTPPRLGGKVRMGVFATRAPFRPNNIGLSCVRLDHIEYTDDKGPLLYVSGVDMVDGTPIVDIKPYQTTSDCHEGAAFGFAQRIKDHSLTVEYDPAILNKLEELKSSGQFDSDRLSALNQLIANDPRPAYQDDPERMYGLSFSAFNFKFKVNGNIARIMDIEKL